MPTFSARMSRARRSRREVPRAGDGSAIDKLGFVINLTIDELVARVRESELQLAALDERGKELQATNRNLSETQYRLRHMGKLAALGELSAMLAHELNQPLTMIMGYASLLTLPGSMPPSRSSSISSAGWASSGKSRHRTGCPR
jgi:C4-dicarboxylate-specific signal transduction histidine kinase